MFQSISSFFRDAFFGKDELPTYVWHNGQSFTITLPYGDDRLAQAELQQLQRIVAYAIYEAEQYCIGAKVDAEGCPAGSEDREFWFKQARKHRAKINKLSTLQYRLKHKIAANG